MVSARGADDTTAEDMRVVLQEGLIMRQYRHQGLRASSSAVHGTGCFAEHGFVTGQFVCDYFGHLVPRNIGTRGRDQVGEGIWGLNESYQVDPRRRCTRTAHTHCTRTAHTHLHTHCTRTELHPTVSSRAPAAHTIGQWINHGCEPNLMSVVTNLRRNLCFTAAEAEVLRLPLQAESAGAPSSDSTTPCPSLATSLVAKRGGPSEQGERRREPVSSVTRQRPPGGSLAVKRPRRAEPACTPLDPGEEADTRLAGVAEETPLMAGGGGKRMRATSALVVDDVDVYDVVCFVALREIAPGEELSYGYHRAVESAVCRCGAVNCRGRY